MLHYKHLFVAILLLIANSASGQSFDAFVRKIHEDYSRWSSMHVVMDVMVYDSTESMPYYRQQVNIKREGDKYWYRFEENEMLLTEEYLIMLDRKARQITCSKRSIEAEKQLASHFKFDIDSVLALYPDPVSLGMEDGMEHFRFLQKNGPISEVHFFITADKLQLKKMEYRYRSGQLARILFQVFRNDIRFEEETFAESNYVSIDRGTIKPSRYFQQYRVLDMTRQ